ncbi:expressed unknown protein [Seminavis robusta]|uniref:Uncharacterized protein n=1 Tax=Seminavis robusta TaxID=568900 RepID=A0A9N8E4C9_9STRA|nr:expressed unknown protein [Seminavis robusta]|eukprot:Sro652_g181720.1 n/a (124) ;mRNA; f:15753-16124
MEMSGADKEYNGADSGEEALCPLFMEGLPRDFASNPQLAAIASLLESDGDDDTDVDSESNNLPIIQRTETKSCKGGGKAKRQAHSNRSSRSHKPYSVAKKDSSKKKNAATVGEAQLFLNMWKL